jgi:ankyrin repeat protein
MAYTLRLMTALLATAVAVSAYGGEIHAASEAGDLAKVKQLIQADATLVNAKDPRGRTPLHWASSAEIAQLLLDNKADVNAKDNAGLTPLSTSIQSDNGDVSNVLLAHGATLDIFTASALGKKDDVARFLGQDPALVNARTPDGRTALYWAALTGQIEVVKLLIANKADVHARDKLNEMPLHAAVSNGHKEVVDLLLANHADVNAKAKNNRTALDIAVMADEGEIAKMLREHGGKSGKDVN